VRPLAKHVGRSTRRWKKLAAGQRAKGQACCYCQQPIDYTLPANHRFAFTVAHWLPVATHPHLAEDPTNIRGSAHRACNSEAGTSVDVVEPQASADW
jgi:hypothetical protein